MQKIFKRIALLLAVALSVVCMGVLASACGETQEEATEFVVTVYYSDGTTKVNGDNYLVVVQFCIEDGSCKLNNPTIDSNGVAKMSIAEMEEFAKQSHSTTTEFVLHALNAAGDTLTLKNGEAKVSKENPTAKLVIDVPAP